MESSSLVMVRLNSLVARGVMRAGNRAHPAGINFYSYGALKKCYRQHQSVTSPEMKQDSL